MRTFKRKVSLLVTVLCFVVLGMVVSPEVVAAGTTTNYTGEFGVTYTVDNPSSYSIYEVVLPESGRIDITLSGYAGFF